MISYSSVFWNNDAVHWAPIDSKLEEVRDKGEQRGKMN